jgi:uncharacterized protein YoxC
MIQTELKSEKVELSLLSDLKKADDKADKIYKDSIKIAEEYEQILKKAQKAKQDVQAQFRILSPLKSKVFQEIKNTSKSLGFGNLVKELNSNPIYKNAASTLDGLDLILRKLNKL